jgi:tRNA(adenine34) deaminase
MLKLNLQVNDEDMMRHCFDLAEQAADQGEYPYAAVIVRKGNIVAATTNRVAQDGDVTRHAEMVAICMAQEALGSTDLSDCTIYANMEPCAFCSYAIRESRIAKVAFSMRSPVMGGASRWDILGDRVLSDTMPEVFAPPPVVLAEFLCEEGDATLRRCAPIVWTFMRSRGLLSEPSPRQTGADRMPTVAPASGFIRIIELVMRWLRRNFFDRFGRGGGARLKRRLRAGKKVTPSP